MADSRWKEVFEKVSLESTQKALSILDRIGILTDEDFPYLTSGAYESGKEYFTAHLVQNGYNGGELLTTAKFIEQHGAIYAIFDSARFEYDEVHRYLGTTQNRIV